MSKQLDISKKVNGTKSVNLRLFSKFMLFKAKRLDETAEMSLDRKISSKRNEP